MRWLLLMGLAACGSGEASPPYGAGECVVTCERVKPQLLQTFGVAGVNCWDAEFVGATSKQACSGIFERRYGLELH